jgi:hypothetical protein
MFKSVVFHRGAVVVALLALSVLVAGNVEAGDKKNFAAHLNGAKQVPSPVDTQAQGQAIFKLKADGTELHYKLIVANIEDVIMAHIHLGAADENGPVAVWLYPDGPPPQQIPGRFDGVLAEGVITDASIVPGVPLTSLADLIDVIRAGGAYVNLHTVANPPGEIRGQIQ